MEFFLKKKEKEKIKGLTQHIILEISRPDCLSSSSLKLINAEAAPSELVDLAGSKTTQKTNKKYGLILKKIKIIFFFNIKMTTHIGSTRVS
jgi:hypothetical protein